MKKLIPALALLVVSAVLMGTSTFAWFSLNNKVNVTGMTVTTHVGDNLFVATSSAGTAKAADSTFKNGLDQTVEAQLQPVSTISAADDAFFYTYDAKANGEKDTAPATLNYIAVDAPGGSHPAKVSDDGGTNYPYDAYADYVIELKAVNAEAAEKQLRLTKINLLYNGATVTEHAYRVAVLSQDQSGEVYAARATNTAADKIFAYTGYTYFDGTAVATASTKAAVSPTVNNGGWYKTVPASQTKYYKVTIRLWLEGEDTDCYSSKFSTLTGDWTLDLSFLLTTTSDATEGHTAATAVTSDANATATPSGSPAAVGTAAITNGETAASYQWYTEAGVAVSGEGTGGTTSEFTFETADSTAKFYCIITTTKGNTYRTPLVTLTTKS